jgi:hypothetical protein
MKKAKHIVIVGKRWFQRTYGNTYHSVSVEVDGEHLDYVPFAYGYDEGYLQTACQILQKHGYYPGDHVGSGDPGWSAFRNDMRENRSKFTIVCVDVDRKKDL